MHSPHHIHYLRRQDIDDTKWDACIQSSPNGLIYGRTVFLDNITGGQWDALVWEDYQAVMPLTWRKKLGFFYLYQPFFTAALGVMGQVPEQSTIDGWLKAIPSRFRLWDFHLNETNVISPRANDLPLKIITRTNYLLPLYQPYALIREGYSRLAGRMLKKAAGLSISRVDDPSQVIDLYRDIYRTAHPELSNGDYGRLNSCAEWACRNGHASAWLAHSANGEKMGFYLAFMDQRFVYSMLGGSTPAGKETGAFYLLTDTLIREYAGREKVFRFEGSDIPGIAFFNSQFGPNQVHYPHVMMNRLPFPINLFKRL